MAYVLLSHFHPKFSKSAGVERERERESGERFLVSGTTSGGAGPRVCMTDSGAIESDLERFQKTFSRSPTYKASLSPRERRVARHETSYETIETRRARAHVHTGHIYAGNIRTYVQ